MCERYVDIIPAFPGLPDPRSLAPERNNLFRHPRSTTNVGGRKNKTKHQRVNGRPNGLLFVVALRIHGVEYKYLLCLGPEFLSREIT